jgi:hypothetical protein
MSATPRLRADSAVCSCKEVGDHVDIFNERNVPVASACTVPLAQTIVRALNSHDALVAALGRYGRHQGCLLSSAHCTCGLDAALRLARGEL